MSLMVPLLDALSAGLCASKSIGAYQCLLEGVMAVSEKATGDTLLRQALQRGDLAAASEGLKKLRQKPEVLKDHPLSWIRLDHIEERVAKAVDLMGSDLRRPPMPPVKDLCDVITLLVLLGLGWKEIDRLVPGALNVAGSHSLLYYLDGRPSGTLGYPWTTEIAVKSANRPAFRKAMAIGPGHLVMDPMMGIGTEIVTLALENPQALCVGYDLNPENLLMGAKLLRESGLPCETVTLAQHDALTPFDFPEGHVDRILLTGWSTFAFSQEEHSILFRELLRCLKPGGRFWIDFIPHRLSKSHRNTLNFLHRAARGMGIQLLKIPLTERLNAYAYEIA